VYMVPEWQMVDLLMSIESWQGVRQSSGRCATMNGVILTSRSHVVAPLRHRPAPGSRNCSVSMVGTMTATARVSITLESSAI